MFTQPDQQKHFLQNFGQFRSYILLIIIQHRRPMPVLGALARLLRFNILLQPTLLFIVVCQPKVNLILQLSLAAAPLPACLCRRDLI
jgi:hypothetical protein